MGYPSLFHGMLSTLPTVHQDPRTCLLQGPVLHVCVLAVFQLFLAVCQQPLLIAIISSLCFSLGRACLRSCVLLRGWWPAAASTIAAATAAATVTLLLAILREKGWGKGE